MAKYNLVSPKAASLAASKDGDGKAMGNLILLALPRSEGKRIFESLEFVRLKLHQVLHESGEVIKSGYF
ncbi:MAG: hypothetical protein ACRD20_05945 [Terriglobales bacterium]